VFLEDGDERAAVSRRLKAAAARRDLAGGRDLVAVG
jgi:hypothetical protein